MEKTVKTAIILAGGNSKRMGEDKTQLNLAGKTIIEIVVGKLNNLFSEIVVAGRNREAFRHLPVKFTEDLIDKPFRNSLTGVHAGLAKSTSDYNLVVACDMPFINVKLIDFLTKYPVNGYDAVVPLVEDGHQALHAIYSKSCVSHIANHLEKDAYRIGYFITCINTGYISEKVIREYDPGLLTFFNINTREDYLKALELVEKYPELVSY